MPADRVCKAGKINEDGRCVPNPILPLFSCAIFKGGADDSGTRKVSLSTLYWGDFFVKRVAVGRAFCG